MRILGTCGPQLARGRVSGLPSTWLEVLCFQVAFAPGSSRRCGGGCPVLRGGAEQDAWHGSGFGRGLVSAWGVAVSCSEMHGVVAVGTLDLATGLIDSLQESGSWRVAYGLGDFRSFADQNYKGCQLGNKRGLPMKECFFQSRGSANFQ